MELWEVLSKWGNVVDIFILERSDKYSQRFGFVCFIHIVDEIASEKKLDNLCVVTYKLRVNIPRFKLEEARSENMVQ